MSEYIARVGRTLHMLHCDGPVCSGVVYVINDISVL